MSGHNMQCSHSNIKDGVCQFCGDDKFKTIFVRQDDAYMAIGSLAQADSLAAKVIRLVEECAELQLSLCKAQRFGWFNWHPDTPNRLNIEDVKHEIDDVVNAAERIEEEMRGMWHTRNNK